MQTRIEWDGGSQPHCVVPTRQLAGRACQVVRAVEESAHRRVGRFWEPVGAARDILQFTKRAAAAPVKPKAKTKKGSDGTA